MHDKKIMFSVCCNFIAIVNNDEEADCYTEQSQKLDQRLSAIVEYEGAKETGSLLGRSPTQCLILSLTTHYQTYKHTLFHCQTTESKTWPCDIVWQATICERMLSKIGLSHPEGHMPFRVKNCLLARQGLNISYEAWTIIGLLQCLRVFPKRTDIITKIALNEKFIQ